MKVSFKINSELSKQNNTSKQSSDSTLSELISHGGRSFLLKLKRKAIRSSNSWYRVLSLDKRRFIDAVIQTVDKIRSSLLLKILTAFFGKLLLAMGGLRGLMGDMAYEMQSFGRPLAQKISRIAVKLGNKFAAKWANDADFVRYLTVVEMNNLPIFKTGSST